MQKATGIIFTSKHKNRNRRVSRSSFVSHVGLRYTCLRGGGAAMHYCTTIELTLHCAQANTPPHHSSSSSSI